MSICKFFKEQECCGTCNWWLGHRKLESIENQMFIIVEGEGAEEKGVCNWQPYGAQNQITRANSSCPKWELLAGLKNL